MTARQLRRTQAVTSTPKGFQLVSSETAEAIDWQELALCAEVDHEIFFPEKGGGTMAAKKVCRACEVTADCLEYALEHDERFGVWGGLSERQRRKLKRSSEVAA